MGKEDDVNFPDIEKALKKLGFKPKVVEIKIIPYMAEAVNEFVMRIERAHEEAGKGNDTLFRQPLTSDLQPSNS